MPIKFYISIIFIILFLAVDTAVGQGRRALFVGISDYPSTSGFQKIHGAEDYEIIGKMLERQGFEIAKLLNGDATASNIRAALDNMAKTSAKGSCVYIHFSCHGQPFEDKPPFDEDDLWDESLVAIDAQKNYQSGIYEGENHIIDDELSVYFDRIRKKIGEDGLLCVVIDACHSGTSSRDDIDDDDFVRGTDFGFSADGKIFAPRINRKGNFQIDKIPGAGDILMLEACRSYQFNKEVIKNGKHYGALSYYVGQVLERHNITRSLDWVDDVNDLMKNDLTLTDQNMVYESSF
ncbi:MAG: caspase family protein [Bacteroidales bacterium]|nr:caspase family protein [Bacteroidales bacterium]